MAGSSGEAFASTQDTMQSNLGFPGFRPSVTLRSHATQDLRSVHIIVHQLFQFLTGSPGQTITLPDVEVVSPLGFGPGPNGGFSGGHIPEDWMDIDSFFQNGDPAFDIQRAFSFPEFEDFSAFSAPAPMFPSNTFLAPQSPPPPTDFPQQAVRHNSLPRWEPPAVRTIIDTRRQRRRNPSKKEQGTTVGFSDSTNTEGSKACRACLDTLSNPIFLDCGHCYCRPCLNSLVRIGIANRASFPPRCCRGRLGIDMEAASVYLDEDVLIRYISIKEEFSTRNPVYCANKFCSRHIEEGRIQSNQGKFIRCNDCDAETCTECKQERGQHVGNDGTACKKPEELMNDEDRQLAKNNEWRQCPGE